MVLIEGTVKVDSFELRIEGTVKDVSFETIIYRLKI